MRPGPIFGYNWQHWLEWPGSITFDVRRYLVIYPSSHNPRCRDKLLPKTLNFPRLLTRCIFVLFFSRSDIREERAGTSTWYCTDSETRQQWRRGGDPADSYQAPDWPPRVNPGLSLVNIEMTRGWGMFGLMPQQWQLMAAAPETLGHWPCRLQMMRTGWHWANIGQHSFGEFISQILNRISELIPKFYW